MNLRKLARGRDCQVRIPDTCNHDNATTVLAHLRLPGLSGMGIKAHDFMGAWACSACHAYVDTHSDDVTTIDFYEGIFRTQTLILKEKELI